MTFRRQQMLEKYADLTRSGERVSLARMARECGLCDYREARRVLGDLRKLGAVA